MTEAFRPDRSRDGARSEAPAPAARPPRPASGKPLVIASFGAFVAALSTSLVAISTPEIARELRVAAADVSWVLTVYLLTISSLLALSGRAADLLGRRRVYLAGFTLFTVGSAACAAAPSLGWLVSLRALQGLGAAMLMAVGPAIVTRSAPPERRARALGVQLATTYAGLTLGPSLGGLLTEAIGWKAIFGVIAVVSAGGLALGARLLPVDIADAVPPPRERRSLGALDLPGAGLLATGLTCGILALKRVPSEGWTESTVLVLATLSALAVTLFTRRSKRHRAPLLPLDLFASRSFVLGIVGATLLYTTTFMLAYLLPFQLQREAHLSPAAAGAWMTVQPATMACVAPLSGVAADRWGPRVPSAAGMSAIAIGMAGLAWSETTPNAGFAIAMALVGLGAGLFVAPNSARIMGSAPKDRQATAGAMVATSRNVGMTLGIALAASLEQALGFRGAIGLAATLGASGAALALVRTRTKNEQP